MNKFISFKSLVNNFLYGRICVTLSPGDFVVRKITSKSLMHEEITMR